MTRPSIRIEGADELRRALSKVEGGTADLKEAHAEGARIIEKQAQQLVPVLSGRLKASIRSTGQARAGVVRAGLASVPYAGPIHFGWRSRNIAPQPFLFDAADDRRDEVLETFEKQIGSIIKKHDLD